MIIACTISLATAGCSLKTPGCGNRDVKASIEKEARASAELWLSTTSSASLSPADARYELSGSYETSRTENTRACAASINVGSGDNQVSVPIEYEVIAADDGQVLYRWDNAAFGKSFVATTIMSGVSKVMSQPAAPAPENPPDPAPAPAPDVAGPWQKNVQNIIVARAAKLTDMPRGSQSFRFRVGGYGEVTNAAAVGDVQNLELANKTIQFLETMDQVPAPPDHHTKWVEMTLTF